MTDYSATHEELYDVVPYFVTDEHDFVVLSGTCQRMHLADHGKIGTLHLGSAPHGQFKFVDGEFEPYAPDVTYEQTRRQAYPLVEEQLDMLWHAMDQGAMPKVEPFYSTLQQVKQQHPKT
ncbi:hypothetical protein [Pseudomonas sp.]|uniref:hypothetical protein n=1 Tax=Pseudomonas sp. TaxID=306 RepID=UPI0028A72B1C|nr:hypothetical protein [Pseudomonas sp.]